MLAVKLHKRKRVVLRRGSYLIPIMTWENGKRMVKEWLSTLNRHNRGAPNDKINYISLVAIPSDHPVYLAIDWSQKIFDDVRFQPFCQIEKEWKDHVQDSCLLPEMILGKALPTKAVKWTKNVKLLFSAKRKRGGNIPE